MEHTQELDSQLLAALTETSDPLSEIAKRFKLLLTELILHIGSNHFQSLLTITKHLMTERLQLAALSARTQSIINLSKDARPDPALPATSESTAIARAAANSLIRYTGKDIRDQPPPTPPPSALPPPAAAPSPSKASASRAPHEPTDADIARLITNLDRINARRAAATSPPPASSPATPPQRAAG